MSADRLREAARTLRERAEAATSGPWTVEEEDGLLDYGVRVTGSFTNWRGAAYPSTVAAVGDAHDADYFLTMQPVVAQSLADWLDDTANEAESNAPVSPGSFAVADAILGGGADE